LVEPLSTRFRSLRLENGFGNAFAPGLRFRRLVDATDVEILSSGRERFEVGRGCLGTQSGE